MIRYKRAMQNKDQMHPHDIRNLIIFMVVSITLWLSYDHFILKPQVETMKAQQVALQKAAAEQGIEEEKILPLPDMIAASPRVKIDSVTVSGSINLKGGRIDDLVLKEYFVKADKKETVTLLSPAGTANPRYTEFGWIAAENTGTRVPTKDAVWQLTSGKILTPDSPVTLRWSNGQGVNFEKTFSLDQHFGFTVEQKVTNNGGKAVTLLPYALVTEHGLPADYKGTAIIHEGPIGYIGEDLVEHDYGDVKDKGRDVFKADSGWIGITQKYWLTALIPAQAGEATYRFIHIPKSTPNGREKYQSDVLGGSKTISPGASADFSMHLFAGAKKVSLLETYEKEWGVKHFDLAVDFGWFYFLTRPFFFVLNLFYGWVGNFGVAILMFTVVLRICVFPLANTSFRSFAKLKQVSPQMYDLREKYKDDKPKLQQELVALYQREKVNPMAGCLPILVQIPIFFALFKVLSNTIEMRHAPFFGWIQDLSAPDPTSIFNLFGIIPWTPPTFLMIGVWPCLMLISMLLQRSLNPVPEDKLQAKMFAAMPWVMTFILAGFASGLVIYWTFNNILSTVQQYIIMRSMGVPVNFFGGDKTKKKLENAVAHGPDVHPSAEMIEHQIEDALSGKPLTPPKPKKKKKK
jgi:YidC/Oxa1 family membrane protein insertase